MVKPFLKLLDQYGIVACNIDKLLPLKKCQSDIVRMARKIFTNNKERASPVLLYFQNSYWCGKQFHLENLKGDLIIDNSKLTNKSGYVKIEFDPRFFLVVFQLNKENTNIPVAQGKCVKRKGTGGNLCQILLEILLKTFNGNESKDIHLFFDKG